jgi:biotin carboxyl carrier protein
MPLVEVVSPWPGRVAQLHVETGSDVKVGQELVTIESMKVLTPISSEHDGRVLAIHVEVNSFVEERSPLLSIERS